MVNILGNKDNGLKTIQQSLITNLNIIASDSRLKTINDKIYDSRYRIKNLSEITLSNMSSCFNFEILDGKVFCFATSVNPGIIEVIDYQSNILLTTISTGATQSSSAIVSDSSYIYIGCIKGAPKSVYIQRYNRCTLAFVDEYLLYQNDTPSFNRMVCVDGFIYCLCMASTGTLQHSIKKWSTTSLTVTTSVYFDTPSGLTASTYGLVVGGRNVGTNANDLQKPVILNYSDLTMSKLFPKTSLTQANWRGSLVIDNNLFIANDSGVLVKYNIDAIVVSKEITVTTNGGVIRGLYKIQNHILVADSFGYMYLYNQNLDLIKKYGVFPTVTSGVHAVIIDLNNTLWYHSYQYPTIYKKQFIDLSSGVM